MVTVGPGEVPERIGRYLVFRPFARGGMASVHLGRLTGPAGFSKLVAMKLLHPMYAAEREYYTMLLDEARLASRIVHPNVVQTLDVVQQGEKLCVVMEYVHGASLANAIGLLVRRGERVPPPVAASILVGVLHGMHAAHEARGEDGTPLGIVHRDISPQNVVVGVDGVARVLDFGVAKALRKETVTREGHIKGKVAYMAPEQLTGAPVTRQADVRAAGVVLWELLVGQRLFEDENEARLITRVLTEEVPPPGNLAPGISAELDDVVRRAVAFDKRERFATAEEMAEALAAVVTPATREDVAAWVQRTAHDLLETRAQLVREAEGYDGEGDVMVVAPREATGDGTAVLTNTDEPATPRRRGYRRAAVAAAAVGVIAAVAFVRMREPSSPAPATPGAEATSAASAATAPSAAGPTAGGAAGAPQTAAGAQGSGAPATLVLDPVVVPTASSARAAATDTRPVAAKTKGRGAQRPGAPAPAVRPGCDPPYSIDADGMKHYKASCLP